MHRILIADDEERIRRGLCKLVEKDSEVQVVAQAEDGEMALELAQETSPDIMLVDINMPFLNGLEFIEQIQEKMPEAVVIIISGYDDFAYVQKALQLGVFDYLLKPVMEQALFDALDKAKAEVVRRCSGKQYMDWAKVQVEKNHRALCKNCLIDWMEQRLNHQEATQQMQYLNMQIPEPCVVTMIGMSVDEAKQVPGEIWDQKLLYYAGENMAMECLDSELGFINQDGDLVILSEATQEYGYNAERLKQLMTIYLPARVTMMQEVCQIRLELPTLYGRLTQQLHQELSMPDVIVQAKKYIEKFYGDEDLSLQNVADYLHVSSQHLSRVFSQALGITFSEYVTKVRICHAMDMLEEGTLKMYEIAEKAGYSSQHYFSNTFKKIVGVSPLEYRKTKRRG